MSTNAIYPSPGDTAAAVTEAELRWWMLPHLTSLDAPTVAVVWQFTFAWTLGERVHPAEAVVLFLSVWLAYAMDRVLDCSRFGAPCRTARHRFAQTYRSALLCSMSVVLAADLLIAWVWLPENSMRSGYPLALAALTYAIVAQRLSQFGRWFLLKEIAVGVIISWGALWASLSHGVGWERALPLLLAGTLVCGWNCIAISIWEAPFSRPADSVVRRRVLQVAHSRFRSVTLWGALMTCGLGVTMGTLHGIAAGVAMGFTMALLAVLDRMSGTSMQNVRRVLADAVLLAPVLLLLLRS